ncbi:hypothetical protein V1291_000033 [Nitrobacteraceae bacterium AZCC 1564]
MGFFAKLFGRTRVQELARGRGWTVSVVGESHYQANLDRQYRKNGGTEHDLKVSAILVPEAENGFDANAVRVDIGGQVVGYLPAQMAMEYRAAFGAISTQCSAKIIGGFALEDGSSAHFGAKLNVSWPPRLK